MFSTTLPPEILHLIIQHAKEDTKTLLKLCLTSRVLLPEAQHVLFTDITLSGLNREATGLTSKANMFLNTITLHNPSLAWNVRSLAYYPSGRRRGQDWWKLMNRSLQLMINLKSFTLEGTHLPPADSIFSDCLFQLRHLSWIDYSRGLFPSETTDDSKYLTQFLSTQQELRCLSTHPMLTRVGSSICPQLETLTGGTRTILNMLPDRNTVTKLIWQTYDPSSEMLQDVECIAEELSHVRTFALGGSLHRPSLVIFTPYLKHVQNLRLFGYSNINFGRELTYISSLPQLQIFVWSPGPSTRMRLSDSDRMPVWAQRDLISDWYKAIPTLRAAYFARCTHRKDVNCYSRWTRDGKEEHVAPTEFMREGNIDS